jgi:hypothetical protein
MKRLTDTERFEVVADLYRRDTGFMRPGKDAPQSSNLDPCSPENRDRFDRWLEVRLTTCALQRVVELDLLVKALEESDV